ncbi:MAG: glycosyltransferase [Pyrinomonadaceae bacterium]|nr:glycosyltransferase [Sphingobacteriaceae bacterium]
MNKLIVHISEVNIAPDSGMGRVEYYWKKSFEENGFKFVHIGPKEVGDLWHKSMFPYKAYRYFKKLNIMPRAFIAHEPTSGVFVKNVVPCFVESHGLERRGWDENIKTPLINLSARTKLLYPIWRLRNCDRGLTYAKKLLLINSDDKAYAKEKYLRADDDIFLFKNGVNAFPIENTDLDDFTILFNGSWIERKGINTLIKAANLLFEQGLKINYLLIGTGKDENAVLNDWPEHLKRFLQVVPTFKAEDETQYLSRSSLFVLPSFSEGQPLSLLQAMAVGKCCITSNCCGQKDIIKNGLNGLLFEPGNHEELALLISKCYFDKHFAERIGKEAEAHVKNFNWEKVSQEVFEYVIRNS